MENAGYLFAAYAIVWAVLFGYIFILSRRQKRLRREIDLLKEVLHKETK
jgi:CcmD family protein